MISFGFLASDRLARLLLDNGRIFISPEGRSRRRHRVPPRLTAPFFCLAIAAGLSAMAPAASARPTAVPPATRSVVLPEAQAGALVEQCSRAVPRITGSWTPSARDVRRLEADLKHLKGQRAAACCSQSAKMDDASRYYRQYAGIVRGGRRLIYVNGFLEPPTGAGAVDWKQAPVIACDGGTSFWGVLYDPDSRTFSQLAFNGAG
jgi:hypothetical protein